MQKELIDKRVLRLLRMVRQVSDALLAIIMTKAMASLCERYLKNFWRLTYRRIMWHYPHPVWFPHRLDLYTWQEHRNCHFLERGIYSHQVINPGDTVLELCCGDGFYSYFFFSGKAAHVDAVDIDDMALAHARQYHSSPNISYRHLNIVKDDFPKEQYNVVVWDSAIRRLKIDDIHIALGKVRDVLHKSNGIFSCYEIFEDKENPIYFITPLTQEDLTNILRQYFPSVQWIKTVTPERTNYYYHCSMI